MNTNAKTMNDIISVTDSAILTMSSREIAKLTVSTHDNVLKTIRSLISKGVVSGNETPYIHPQNGQTYQEFNLTYRDTMVVVSGYSVELRAKIIDRWQELESKPTHKIPESLPEALRLAADLADNLTKAKKELEIAAPKAEALDRIASPTEGAVCLRIAAKLLQIPEKKFIQFAHAKGFIFRGHFSRVWQGYGDKVKKGLVEMKITEIRRDDGSIKNVEQALITRAGIAKLAELLEVEACE